MSFKDQLTSAWSKVIAQWGEDIYLVPCNDPGQQTAAVAVIEEDAEEGTNEVPGDGKVLDRETGREYRHSAKMEIARSYGVVEDAKKPWRVIVFDSDADKTAFDAGDTTLGRHYKVKRRLGRDRDSETFLIVHVSPGIARRARRRG